MHATATGTPPEVKTRGRIPDRTVLLVASFGAFLAFLDATIVNVAFPNIRESFPDSTISSLSWILNAYSIVFAAFLVVSGRLADLVGRRRTFTNGVLLFTIASVLCAVAPSVEILIAFRVVQALGAALLVPASLALVVEAFPAEQRSHAVGCGAPRRHSPPDSGRRSAAPSSSGATGGGRSSSTSPSAWRPCGPGAGCSSRAAHPGAGDCPTCWARRCRRSCWARSPSASSRASDWGWTSPATIACFVAAAVLLAVFVVSSRRHRSPLIDPALLRVRPFVVGNVATIVAGRRLLRVPADQHPVAAVRLGLLDPRCRASPSCRARSSRRSSRRDSARSPQKHGYRKVIVPGAIIWALAYVWYATPGRGHSGLLGSLAARADPLGHRRRGDASRSRQRGAGRRPGRSLRHGLGGQLERPPDRRRPRASRSWSSSSGRRRPRPPWTACAQAGSFSAACFAVTAVVAVFIGRVRAHPEAAADDDSIRPPAISVPDPSPRPRPSSSALSQAPLLSRLPDDVRARLEAEADPVELPAGELLFSAGDPADDVYVVTAGLLDVEQGGEVIRQLGAGAVLGELALLTGGTRSAVDPGPARQPPAARVARDLRASGLRRRAGAAGADRGPRRSSCRRPRPPPPARPPRPRVVAVVAVHPGAPADAVADALGRRTWRRTLRLARPGSGGAGRARARRTRERLRAAGRRTTRRDEWWAMCVRQADLLIVVAAVRRAGARGCLRSGAPRWTSCSSDRRPRARRSGTGRRALGAYRITQATGPLAGRAASGGGAHVRSLGRGRDGRRRRPRVRPSRRPHGARGRGHRRRPGRRREPGGHHRGRLRARVRCRRPAPTSATRSSSATTRTTTTASRPCRW